MFTYSLEIPAHVMRGIRPNEKGARMDTLIYGADSETKNGEPMTFQFYSEHVKLNRIEFVNARNATEKFFAVLESLKPKCQHVFYCHNLDFDLPEFFWSVKEKLVAISGGEYEFTYGDWHVSGVYGKPTFAKCVNRRRQVTVIILDSFSWFQSSLAKAAEIVCPNLPKLKFRDKDFGSKQYKRTDKDFVAYAMRDAEIAFHIGVLVQEFHREFDIQQAVSLADMSAKIFRHHFLRYTIPQPSTDIVRAAWHSYHGGKNNVVPGAAPAWHLDVAALDISSAYPYAMSELPAFSNGKLYKRLDRTTRAPRYIEPLGVYLVSGDVQRCDWPVIFTHSFEPITEGRFSDVWIQGYELAEAVSSGEVKVRKMRGYYYDSERDTVTPALKAFVEYFYKLKSTEKNPTKRYMYKIILNALYGKFIQTRKTSRVLYTDIDTNETTDSETLIAGGMFHPFIATATTAHTRAYIHQVEHAHRALHTATDGVFAKATKPKRIAGRPREGLGSLQVEARGDLCLLRNKCYLMYAPNGKTVSQYFAGKRIAKFAKHGFQGTVYDLERMVAHRKRKYTASRPNRLREAVKRGLPVNKFETRDYTLKVGPIAVKR